MNFQLWEHLLVEEDRRVYRIVEKTLNVEDRASVGIVSADIEINTAWWHSQFYGLSDFQILIRTMQGWFIWPQSIYGGLIIVNLIKKSFKNKFWYLVIWISLGNSCLQLTVKILMDGKCAMDDIHMNVSICRGYLCPEAEFSDSCFDFVGIWSIDRNSVWHKLCNVQFPFLLHEICYNGSKHWCI